MKLTSELLKKLIKEELESMDETETMTEASQSQQLFDQKMPQLMALVAEMKDLKMKAREEEGRPLSHPHQDNFVKWASDALYDMKKGNL
tara:strand:+ start:98 stop:364 length:267 start_codon:yes stop_codon:yes gene_type:complete